MQHGMCKKKMQHGMCKKKHPCVTFRGKSAIFAQNEKH